MVMLLNSKTVVREVKLKWNLLFKNCYNRKLYRGMFGQFSKELLFSRGKALLKSFRFFLIVDGINYIYSLSQNSAFVFHIIYLFR